MGVDAVKIEAQTEAPELMMLGPVPFVIPSKGLALPCYLEAKIKESRYEAARQSIAVRPDWRQVQRLVADLERRIGTTPDQIITATRGMTFDRGCGPRSVQSRQAVRRAERIGPTAAQRARLRRADKLSAGDVNSKRMAVSIRRQVEAELKEQARLRAVEAGIAETLQLAALRGEQFSYTRDKLGAVRLDDRHGLQSLMQSGKITSRQCRAGLAYAVLYVIEQRDLRSGLAQAAPTSTRDHDPAGVRFLRAKDAVLRDRVEQAIARSASGERRLLLLRTVAGEGRSLRSLCSGGSMWDAGLRGLCAALDQVERALGDREIDRLTR